MSADLAVQLAVQAAGPVDPEWETRVNMLVPVVAAALRPPREGQRSSSPMLVAQQVLEAQVIFGTYITKALDEGSQRYVVRFQADNAQEPEEMRTHRVDEVAGHAMVLRLMQIHEGDRCAFFRYTETAGRTTKVRILVAIEKQPPKDARVAAAHQRRRGPAERPPGEPPTPGEAPAKRESTAAIVRGLLAQADDETRRRAQGILKSEFGWATAEQIPDDMLEQAMYIARYGRADFF